MLDVIKQGKEGARGSDYCGVAALTTEAAPYLLSCGHEALTSSFPQKENKIVMGKVRCPMLLFPTRAHVLGAWSSAKLHERCWSLEEVESRGWSSDFGRLP